MLRCLVQSTFRIHGRVVGCRLPSRMESNSLSLLKHGSTQHCNRYYSSDSGQKNDDVGKISDEEWKKKLTPEQFNVCRKSGTEPAFTGEYNTHKETGTYNCICCGVTLFSSSTKYDSGSGWPSFYDAYKDESKPNVDEKPDNSGGRSRTEVVCKQCRAHLGHKFPDGPEPTGLRYCINSLALKFQPKKT